MGASEFGPWEPLQRDEVSALMHRVGGRWWFSGGHALELHVGRAWRDHDDIDVSVLRSDSARLLSLEPDFEIHVAAAGVLRRWTGWDLSAVDHENNLWVRRPGGTWAMDVQISDGDAQRWIHRRDHTFRLDWNRAVLTSRGGLPYLAPALQLLYKSTTVRPKDDVDAGEVIASLDPWSLAVLDVRLAAHHPWLALVADHRRGMLGDDVVELLELLSAARVDVWVDGGWGVDALLGSQHRSHGDLDLALPTRQWRTALDALGRHGFTEVRDDGRYNVVLLDDLGRLVDLHAFDDTTIVVGADGVERHGPDGLAYVTGGFGGRGVIAGREVACMTAEFQMSSHTGYDVDVDDFHDVERLHRRFGLPIPDDYTRWLDG